jgi:hypothetical protein
MPNGTLTLCVTVLPFVSQPTCEALLERGAKVDQPTLSGWFVSPVSQLLFDLTLSTHHFFIQDAIVCCC